MTKQLCIVHANCQGEPLIERLNLCPDFANRYDTFLVTNYTRQAMPEEGLNRCGLFLYQYLAPGWGDLSSKALLARLPSTADHLCIPNMFFKGYWPFWNSEPGFDYRCTFLEEYIGLGLSPEETIMLYLRADPSTRHDLLKLVSDTIARERERESHTPVKYLDVITANYRDERLFNTVNHPGSRLMNHVARGILRELGFTPPDQESLACLGEPFPEFEQPVDPRIGKFFGWDFADETTEYRIYGRTMTYARYVANYVTARQAGVTDFIGFLQGTHIHA